MAYEFNSQVKDATDYTKDKNKAFTIQNKIVDEDFFQDEYPFASDRCLLKFDFDEYKNEAGEKLVDYSKVHFLEKKEIPDSVNPSQWDFANLTTHRGVFSVVGRDVIQVRGIGLNQTFVRTKTGWIEIDALHGEQPAEAGLRLAEKALGENIQDNLKAVILTLELTDMYGNLRGGIKRILTKDQLGRVPVYAPKNMSAWVARESVNTSVTNTRRAAFQFAGAAEFSERGFVTESLELGRGVVGVDFGSVKPTNFIEKDGEELIIDGIHIECQLTQNIGAPAELFLYFREYKTLYASEGLIGGLHNIYPIRGGEVRDSNAWANYIYTSWERFGERTDVVIQSSNWPHWNTKENPNVVKNYLLDSAAMYKYLHDETLYRATLGDSDIKIANTIELPEAIQSRIYTRPYYGSYKAGVRAIYSKHIGFYDANPIKLLAKDEVAEAKDFIEYVGSRDLVLKKAVEDFEKGEYLRSATYAWKLVLADSEDKDAKYLTADALEQLAYQEEAASIRNSLVQAALELRQGIGDYVSGVHDENPKAFLENSKQMSTPNMLNFLGIALDKQKAQGKDLKFQLLVDTKDSFATDEYSEKYLVSLVHGTLLYTKINDFREDVPLFEIPAGLLLSLESKKLHEYKEYIKCKEEDFHILEELEELTHSIRSARKYKIMEA